MDDDGETEMRHNRQIAPRSPAHPGLSQMVIPGWAVPHEEGQAIGFHNIGGKNELPDQHRREPDRCRPLHSAHTSARIIDGQR